MCATIMTVELRNFFDLLANHDLLLEIFVNNKKSFSFLLPQLLAATQIKSIIIKNVYFPILFIQRVSIEIGSSELGVKMG